MSFHFANELWPYLFWFNCDFDVIKPNFRSRRPDIIFHRRGTHLVNALVVEIKREANPLGVKGDITKIRENWFEEPLAYCYGASVLLNEATQTFSCHVASNDDNDPIFFRSDDGLPWRAIADRESREVLSAAETMEKAIRSHGEEEGPPLCADINAALRAIYPD